MKIALISTPFFGVPPPGYSGLEQVVWDEACALAELGEKVVVFAPGNKNPPKGFLCRTGEPLTDVNVNWLEKEMEMYQAYKDKLSDFDVVHGHGWFGCEYLYKQEHPDAKVCHTHHGHCFVEGTLVPTVQGVKQIEAIRVGEMVYSHDSSPHKVTKVFKRRYSGPVKTIKLWGVPTFKVTPEHPFLGYRTIKGSCQGHRVCTIACQKRERHEGTITYIKKNPVTSKCRYGFKSYTDEWIKAGDLHEGDYLKLVMPDPQKESALSLPPRLIGYYLSEGSLAIGKRTWMVRFHLSPKETEIASEILNLLKPYGNPKIQLRGRGLVVEICSKRLVEELRSICGSGAKDKRVPIELLCSIDAQEVLTGMMRGDGTLKKDTLTLCSVSPSIAWGARVLLSWMGLASTYRVEKGRIRKFEKSENPSICKDQYWVSVHSRHSELFGFPKIIRRKPERKTGFVSDRAQLNYRVKTVSTENYDGDVYNLEVEGSQSYNIMQCTAHNCLWRSKPPGVEKLNLIAISRHMAFEYSKIFQTEVEYCYNGINLERYPFKQDKGDRLLFVGRISTAKRPDIAIEIAKRVGMKLDVVGGTFVPDKGYVEGIRRSCEQNGFGFYPDAPHEVKIELLKNARALLFPSMMGEPFGLVAVEAMACGTPVVATKDGAIPEIVEEGRVGFTCYSLDEMCEAVKKIDGIRPQDCRLHAERFSREAMAQNYLKLYNAILDGDEW